MAKIHPCLPSCAAAVCAVLLGVTSAAAQGPTLTKKISQFGITWSFQKDTLAGQFANGDWWVVGPVTLVEISPRSVSGGRVMHGSMVNPTPKNDTKQGYDTALIDYVPQLNVALDVSASAPLVLQPGNSLVSTISEPKLGSKPQLLGASVLTVLAAAAAEGSFRPSYSGADKSIRFNKSQLQYSRLRRLKPPVSAPGLATLERMVERPWIDHMPGWRAAFMHPKDNMENYGRDMAVRLSEISLMLHLDIDEPQKERLLIRMVQHGIDLWGVVQAAGGNGIWYADGGISSGRKWPILFAGLMLDDPAMTNVGKVSCCFGEDQQTFVVEETSPGVFNKGFGGYTSVHKGMAEWGIRHSYKPEVDSALWTAPYRQCCTANSWVGFVLVAHLMGAKELWNHPPLFAYVDRYVVESRKMNDPQWQTSMSLFALQMWDEYRDKLGTPTGLGASQRPGNNFAKPAGVGTSASKVVEIRLRWDRGSAANAKQFNVYRGTNALNLSLLKKGVNGYLYVDTEVPTGGTYYYAVTGVDDQGKESPRSETVHVQT